ncbi:uncharacterized protein EAE97_004251 [Botrytis byssoidea]|uniref:Uncharacterized protein n=1 Tax=Botrytis byssoidea TaxID=139641 RepID=A0A9P5IMA5_9HELO|nr:uncharacterized protein EAE97_004251 [Botrytis byssoidea]KAF7947002.1 hypothetical protein EAE97_004251 [Botrytis byssoidea]
MQNDRLSNIHGIQSYCEYQTEAATPFGTQNMQEHLYAAKLAKVRERSAGLQRLNDDALFELGSDIGSPDLNRTRSMRGLPVFFLFD